MAWITPPWSSQSPTKRGALFWPFDPSASNYSGVPVDWRARLYENQLLGGWVPFPKAAADVVAARAERYKTNCISSNCFGNLSWATDRSNGSNAPNFCMTWTTTAYAGKLLLSYIFALCQDLHGSGFHNETHTASGSSVWSLPTVRPYDQMLYILSEVSMLSIVVIAWVLAATSPTTQLYLFLTPFSVNFDVFDEVGLQMSNL